MSSSEESSNSLSLSRYLHKVAQYTTSLHASLELRRQDQRQGETEFYDCTEDHKKRIIATYRELTISRNHTFVEPLPDHSLRVHNRSMSSVALIDSDRRLPTDTCEVEISVLLTLEDRVVRVEQHVSPKADSSPIAQPTLVLG